MNFWGVHMTSINRQECKVYIYRHIVRAVCNMPALLQICQGGQASEEPSWQRCQPIVIEPPAEGGKNKSHDVTSACARQRMNPHLLSPRLWNACIHVYMGGTLTGSGAHLIQQICLLLHSSIVYSPDTCMHVCMYVFVCTYLNACIGSMIAQEYVTTYVCHTRMYVYMYVYVCHIHMSVCTYLYARSPCCLLVLYVWMYVRVLQCVYVCVHIWVYKTRGKTWFQNTG